MTTRIVPHPRSNAGFQIGSYEDLFNVPFSDRRAQHLLA